MARQAEQPGFQSPLLPGSGRDSGAVFASSSARARPGVPKPVFWGAVVLVVLAPLPLGSVYQWSWSALALATGLLLAFQSLHLARQQRLVLLLPSTLFVPAGLFCLVMAFAGFQASSWIPAAWQDALWPATAERLLEERAASGSLAPYDSISSILRMLTYSAVFIIFFQVGRRSARADKALFILVQSAAAYSLYGIAMEFSGAEKILWYDKTAYRDAVTATFVNRNAFASFAGFGLLAALALILRRLVRFEGSEPALRQLYLADSKATLGLLVAILVLGTALVLSTSRGGILAAFCGLLALILPLMANRDLPLRRIGGRLLLSMLGLGLVLFVLIGNDLAVRLAADPVSGEAESRLAFYRAFAAVVAERPWQGFGLGSFTEVFYLFNDGSFVRRWSYGHNLYLELAIELGVPMAAALIVAVGWIAAHCLAGAWQGQRDPVFGALGFAVTITVAVHGLVDYTLVVPAVALSFVALLGLAAARAQGHEGDRRRETSA